MADLMRDRGVRRSRVHAIVEIVALEHRELRCLARSFARSAERRDRVREERADPFLTEQRIVIDAGYRELAVHTGVARQLLFGTSEIQRLVIARQLLTRP